MDRTAKEINDKAIKDEETRRIYRLQAALQTALTDAAYYREELKEAGILTD